MPFLEIEWPSPSKITRREIGEGIVLGRSADCDLILDDSSISTKHTWIKKTQAGYVLIDLKSKNGTWVEGRRISEVPLKPGHAFKIADIQCRLMDDSPIVSGQAEVKKAVVMESPSRQCPVCLYLVPESKAWCPRCGADLNKPMPTAGEPAGIDADRARKMVRALSSLAFAGGIFGPLLLGVGWLLGIVAGVLILTGFRAESERKDRKMAATGIVLGCVWIIIGITVFIALGKTETPM